MVELIGDFESIGSIGEREKGNSGSRYRVSDFLAQELRTRHLSTKGVGSYCGGERERDFSI